ncbi:hypothetical protein BGZ92_007994 [Podila epicladia]|nr:hypothetical protein BGZ92_007994 [Podila epicladia]
MKFNQPFLLLSLSMANALILLSSATPSISTNKRLRPNSSGALTHVPHDHSRPISYPQQQHRQHSPVLSSASGTSKQASAIKNNNRLNAPSQKYNRAHPNAKHRHRNGATSSSSSLSTSSSRASKRSIPADASQPGRHSITYDDEDDCHPKNRPISTYCKNKNRQQPSSQQHHEEQHAVEQGYNPNTPKRRAPLSRRASLPSSSSTSQRRTALVKRASKSRKTTQKKKPSFSNTSKTIDYRHLPADNTPLLLLPDANSVWQAGSSQRVAWSRKKYSKAMPADTTVDIVLVDANTNQKLFSLKRFVPFSRGAVQVWVPRVVPEGVSFVLVLELYHGRSQEQVGSTPPPAASSPKSSSIVRRSDINISPGASRKYARDGGANSPYGSRSPSSDNNRDLYENDYYSPASEDRPLDFLPDEMRQEDPNVRQPLELKHTFGLHQKVYTLTPYTLEWKLPPRVVELLDYSKTLAELRRVYMSKLVVELVKDHSLESAVVLAKDVPAETMFLYLRIQERVPQDFYRLRIRMVVVEYSALSLGASSRADGVNDGVRGGKTQILEGGAFPSGGKVVDRFEAITRRFWVTEGAL